MASRRDRLRISWLINWSRRSNSAATEASTLESSTSTVAVARYMSGRLNASVTPTVAVRANTIAASHFLRDQIPRSRSVKWASGPVCMGRPPIQLTEPATRLSTSVLCTISPRGRPSRSPYWMPKRPGVGNGAASARLDRHHLRPVDLHAHAALKQVHREDQDSPRRAGLDQDPFQAGQGPDDDPHPPALAEVGIRQRRQARVDHLPDGVDLRLRDPRRPVPCLAQDAYHPP